MHSKIDDQDMHKFVYFWVASLWMNFIIILKFLVSPLYFFPVWLHYYCMGCQKE